MAGENGFTWQQSRLALDALESYQQGKFTSEGMTTQLAQKVGYDLGIKTYAEEHPIRYMINPPDAPFPRRGVKVFFFLAPRGIESL